MKYSFEIEIRESDNNYEPMLYGTILQEGRAASGGRREVFCTPGSVEWPSEGVAIAPVIRQVWKPERTLYETETVL